MPVMHKGETALAIRLCSAIQGKAGGFATDDQPMKEAAGAPRGVSHQARGDPALPVSLVGLVVLLLQHPQPDDDEHHRDGHVEPHVAKQAPDRPQQA